METHTPHRPRRGELNHPARRGEGASATTEPTPDRTQLSRRCTPRRAAGVNPALLPAKRRGTPRERRRAGMPATPCAEGRTRQT
ncbi:MAG TPA: hypothetical protein PLD98_05500, partial [Clostridiales bacterium]|nr:hypothetical protein [Clostridiales bacterium]